MSMYGNKLQINAGESATVEVHHADGYKLDVHSVEYKQEYGIIKVVVM